MTERILECIGRETNKDIQGWYQTKVNEMALFLVKKIREDAAILKKLESEELEVIVK